MTEALHIHPIHALVVDDSAVARKVLTSILQREGLEVDMVVSAEDALVFLNHRQPDVIFMDHTMPGMDGFAALKAIKANPKTTAIPVMMFTAQSGENYLRQARAIGAIDVLQKDSLADIDISARLRELGIDKSASRPTTKATLALVENKTSARQRELATLVRLLVREEFKQFKGDLPVLLKEHQQHLDNPHDDNPPEWSAPTPRKRRLFSRFGGGLLLAILGTYIVGWQLGKHTTQNDTSKPQTMVETPVETQASEALTPPAIGLAPDALNIISWALGDKMYYSPEEAPLSGERQQRIETLLEMLADSNFRGVVQLTVHQGQFCAVTNAQGESQLAAAASTIDQCNKVSGDINSENARLMSLPFAMFIESSPLTNGEHGIQLDIKMAGNAEPAVNYPNNESTVLAQTWNQIAALNNRVEIQLLPTPIFSR